MIKKEEVFKIGQFAKPHGIKGEIAWVTDSDLLDEVTEDTYSVCEMEGILVPFFVESCRNKNTQVVLVKLEGVDSEADARDFAGRDVFYPLDELDDDWSMADMTWDNLIGYTLVDAKQGVLGPVTHVDDSTQNVLLSVERDGEELLLPAVEAWIEEIDLQQRRLVVTLPEGLLDL